MQQVYVLLRADISKGGVIDLFGPFMDAGGYCYLDVPFEKEETFANDYRQHSEDTMEGRANIIILESDTNRICGCYPNGNLFASAQWDRRADRRYHARCETTQVIYIPPDARPTSPLTRLPNGFIFPPQSSYAELDSLMVNLLNGVEKENLVLYPPSTKLLHEIVDKDFEVLFNEHEETGDCRLLPLLLVASQQAMSAGDDEFAAYCNAFALLNLAMPDMALDVLKPLLLANPMYVDALLLSGICQMRLDQMAASIESLNKALALQDADIIRYYLGIAYDWNGYSSIAYRLFKSLQEQYWQDMVKDILDNMEIETPYVTGTIGDVHLPAAYPLPWSCQPRSKVQKDFQGREQYVCFIRDKGIQATPEEYVRQEFVQHLIKDLGYPKTGILIEESLTHIDRSLRERVDILVVLAGIQRRQNLLMVECKASHVPLDGIVGEQALRYNQILSAEYIILTNGIETQVYHFDKQNEKYVAVIAIPTYAQLLSDKGVKNAPHSHDSWVRPEYDTLSDPRVQQAYLGFHLGSDTDETMRPAILNLALLLQDDSHTLPCPFAASPFSIIKDNGLTTKAVGNPSGGLYQGIFRWFSVQDNNKRIYHVYLSVFESFKNEAELNSENAESKSILMAAVDKRGQPISVLQVDIGRHFHVSGSGYELTHSGIRSRAKVEDLMPHIVSKAPYLLGSKERITLGYLDTSKNLLMSDPQTSKVIANIISYALIRFQLRES